MAPSRSFFLISPLLSSLRTLFMNVSTSIYESSSPSGSNTRQAARLSSLLPFLFISPRNSWKSTVPLLSASTSRIISWSSFLVVRIPNDSITWPNSFTSMSPPPSASKTSKACLSSASCWSVNNDSTDLLSPNFDMSQQNSPNSTVPPPSTSTSLIHSFTSSNVTFKPISRNNCRSSSASSEPVPSSSRASKFFLYCSKSSS
mmetsp:Transcript_17583/g.38713  ORF Transcript_17583/g.38713 Transcript_17583/m.38713 type:complete len:202 (-) Transcript_17583:369-974(-)